MSRPLLILLVLYLIGLYITEQEQKKSHSYVMHCCVTHK